MNGESVTECWKCKHVYPFVKDQSGSTLVTCPKCGSNATVKSKSEQPKTVAQKPIEKKQSVNRKKIKIPSFMTIVLCVGLAIASCCVIIIQASNSDLQSQLTFAKNNLTDAQNILVGKTAELSFTLNNLTLAKTQIVSLQTSLSTAQNDLAMKTMQLQSKVDELNAFGILFGNTSQSFNNTNQFIKSYYNATSIYYNGTSSELIAYQKYNASEIHFNNNNWTNASVGFNETKTYYNIAKQRYQLSADKFNESYSYTNNILYKNLTNKYRDMMNSSVKQIRYLYNETEYMRIASMYFNTSNNTEGNQSVDNATIQHNLYMSELITYNAYFNETKVILAQIENES